MYDYPVILHTDENAGVAVTAPDLPELNSAGDDIEDALREAVDVGRFHLAENLRLAQHQRIQPRGHAHHVTNGSIVFMDISAGTQFIEAQVMVVRQPFQHAVCRKVVLLYIELTAIAGGEDRSFATVG